MASLSSAPHVEGDTPEVERLGVVGLLLKGGGQIARRALPVARVHALQAAGAEVEGAEAVAPIAEESEEAHRPMMPHSPQFRAPWGLVSCKLVSVRGRW